MQAFSFSTSTSYRSQCFIPSNKVDANRFGFKRACRRPQDARTHQRPGPFKSRGSQVTLRQANPGALTKQASTLDTPVATEVEQPEQSTEQFDYTRAWYPMAILDDLDPKRPHAMQLLNQDLVAWRDAQGVWRVFEDMCPHRLASLSEGRIEPSDGSLQCAYHGWRFNGEGRCTTIPQITDPKAQATACSSSRSCTKVYPTKEAQGLLWVWGSSGPAAAEESSQASPDLIPEEGWSFVFPWFMRDLPYSYHILLENLADPAHVPFSHHGVQGNRNKANAYENMKSGPIDLRGGFSCLLNKDDASKSVSFRPPSTLRYEFGKLFLNTYVVPVRPGWTRVVVSTTAGPKAPFFVKVLSKMPKWLDHAIQRNQLLDGDSVFLRLGEGRLNSKNHQWKEAFYMPAPADAGVITLRQWLDKFAGGTGPCATTGDADLPRLPRSQVLDRYEQHVKHCPACQKAVGVMGGLKTACIAAAALFMAAAAAAAKAATGLGALVQWESGKWLAAALVAGLVHKAVDKFLQRYHFEDYVHAEK